MICKKGISLFFLFLTFPLLLISQKQGQPLVDSLLKVLPNLSNDKDKADLLNELSHNYFYIKTDDGLKYGSQALAIAQKSDLKEQLGDAYDGIGINFTGKGDYDTAINCFNISQNIFEQLNDKKMIARELGNEGLVYNAQSDYPKALKYFLDALKMAEDVGDTRQHKVGIRSSERRMHRAERCPGPGARDRRHHLELRVPGAKAEQLCTCISGRPGDTYLDGHRANIQAFEYSCTDGRRLTTI